MIKYRSLHKYKYQLMADYYITVDALPDVLINTPFISLSVTGDLHIRKGYCWDGCSGPTIDDKTNMRAGLVHDALFQCLRTGILSQDYFQYANDLFREMCLEDGMPKYRAWYYHKAVSGCFGKAAAKPND